MADDREPRILLLSHRNVVANILARCAWFEFEDLIGSLDGVQMLSPARTRGFEVGYRVAASIGRRLPMAINPGVPVVRLDREYDLFFTMCTFPTDLLYVNALKNWRENCKTAICWIDELLLKELCYVKYLRKIVSKFDHVILSSAQAASRIREFVSGKCIFLPPGIDALLFCPYPDAPPRSIDVLSIGRRSRKAHLELLQATEQRKIFYVYDTISSEGSKHGLSTTDFRQHRLLLANLARRSRYFLVNPGKFDQLEVIGGEELIGARFFEGAAAGMLMIGKKPANADFSKHFFWPDAVIEPRDDAFSLAGVLAEMDGRKEQQERIRRDGVGYSLLYHDWLYRWEAVLKLAGLKPLAQLLQRKAALRKLAEQVLGAAEAARGEGFAIASHPDK